MSKYELSIGIDYVSKWGIVEAVREVFQNAFDEERVNNENKMFFNYNEETGTLQIGNKASVLQRKTLLLGVTTKKDDKRTVGQYGEGYKIASVICLRTNHTFTVLNYAKNEIWKTRLVKSRRYDNMLVPTFFVEKFSFLSKPSDCSLIFEIGNVTRDEYKAIVDSNLYLQKKYNLIGDTKETDSGSVLLDKKKKGKIYVAGLYVCEHESLEYGYDFKSASLDRDRDTVSESDVKWGIASVLGKIKDTEFVASLVDKVDGENLGYCSKVDLENHIVNEFIEEYGTNAIPVKNQQESERFAKEGYKPIMLTPSRTYIIRNSHNFSVKTDVVVKSLYTRLDEFIDSLKDRMTSDEVEKANKLLEDCKLRLL